MTKFYYKGLMCPVFTPFTTDKKSVDYSVIEKYGQYLNTKGVKAIYVNGTTGEGTVLTVEERKRLAEEWLKTARKYGMHMILSIGGTDIADVYDMAEHAERINVDAIVLLPDLFYKPATEEDLVEYFKDIFKYAPTRPFYYYHIPEHTNLYLNVLRLYELLERAYPNFSGVYYRYTNLELANTLLKEGYKIILSTDTILSGALTLGFETISSITLNIYPENVMEVYDYAINSKYREARESDEKLYRRIRDIVAKKPYGWVEIMKAEFNKKVDFKIGETRRPRTTYNYHMK